MVDEGIIMGSVRASARRLGSFFAFYSPVSDPGYGELTMDRGAGDLSRVGTLGSVRWRWVLTTAWCRSR